MDDPLENLFDSAVQVLNSVYNICGGDLESGSETNATTASRVTRSRSNNDANNAQSQQDTSRIPILSQRRNNITRRTVPYAHRAADTEFGGPGPLRIRSALVVDLTESPVPRRRSGPHSGSSNGGGTINENGNLVIDLCSPITNPTFTETTKPKPSTFIEERLKCAVCLELSLDKRPTATKCGHLFCEDCIRRAVLSIHKCPICNARIINGRSLQRLFL